MAEQRTRFVGTYEHGLDDKGRMVLPAKIRAQLGETGMVGMWDRCLGLWTVEGFDRMSDRLADSVEKGEASMDTLRAFMAYAAEVTPDQQGRVVIPQGLRDYAELGSEVVVNGCRIRAEIWGRVRWEALTSSLSDGGTTDVGSTVAALRI
jgi:MraZ protein